MELPFGKQGTGKRFAVSPEDPLCSVELPEPFPSTFLCLETEESLWMPLLLLALLGGSWPQASASCLGLFCAGLAGFWEDEDETSGGGSGSFLEGSEEGRGVFDLEGSLWEDEADDCDLISFSSLVFLLSWSLSDSPFLFLANLLAGSELRFSGSGFFAATGGLSSGFPERGALRASFSGSWLPLKRPR